MARKLWRIETAAGMLAEPVTRTQKRVDDGELPLVMRNGERFVPSAAVLELRERLLQRLPPLPPKELKAESAPAQQQQPNKLGHLGRKSVEFSASTVSEAVDLACSELGVSRDELSYEVRDTGLLHVLGLGSNPATIVVHADAPTSVDSSDGPSDADAALPSSDEEDVTTEEPTAAGAKKFSSSHYYSLGQAALILKTSHDAVRALVAQDKVSAEEIGGYLRHLARWCHVPLPCLRTRSCKGLACDPAVDGRPLSAY